jgi:hypothetical protein
MNDESDPPQPKKLRPTRKSKALSPHYRANNEGGYGNPPVKDQFNGKAGPGRPKKEDSLEAAVQAMFKGKIRIKGDDSKMLSMPEAIAIQIRKLMFSGNRKDFELGLKLYDKYGPKENSIEPLNLDLSFLSDHELAFYGSLGYRFSKEPVPENSNFDRAVGTYRMAMQEDGNLRLERISDEHYWSDVSSDSD